MSEFRLADELRGLDGPVEPDNHISDETWMRIAREFDGSRSRSEGSHSRGLDQTRLGRGVVLAAVAAVVVLAVILPLVFVSGGGGPLGSSGTTGSQPLVELPEGVVEIPASHPARQLIEEAGSFGDFNRRARASLVVGANVDSWACGLSGVGVCYVVADGIAAVAVFDAPRGAVAVVTGPGVDGEVMIPLNTDALLGVESDSAAINVSVRDSLGGPLIEVGSDWEPPATTTTTAPVETMLPTSTPIALDQPVPFQVLAVNPSRPGAGTTVIDLSERAVVTYPPGTGLSIDRTEGAVPAPDDAWITWSDGHAYLWADGLDQVTAHLGPDEVRLLDGIAPALRAIPDPSGRRVWLVQPGLRHGDQDEPTLIQLVPLDGGPPILDLETGQNAFPVAATASGLVLNTHIWGESDAWLPPALFDNGDGYVTEPGSQRVIRLSADGVIQTVGSGMALAASSDRIARLACPADQVDCDPFSDMNRLVITDPDGTNPVEAEGPFEGVWRSVGGPAIPSDSMPLQTISPAGVEMLVSISPTVDINATQIAPILVAVNLADGSSRRIADVGSTVAAWSRDGQWIVVISGRDVMLIDADDPDQVIELPDLIPEDFWPLAAG